MISNVQIKSAWICLFCLAFVSLITASSPFFIRCPTSTHSCCCSRPRVFTLAASSTLPGANAASVCVYVFTSEALNLSGRYRFRWLLSILISAAPVMRCERHRLDVGCRTFAAAATSAVISYSVTRPSDTNVNSQAHERVSNSFFF